MSEKKDAATIQEYKYIIYNNILLIDLLYQIDHFYFKLTRTSGLFIKKSIIFSISKF